MKVVLVVAVIPLFFAGCDGPPANAQSEIVTFSTPSGGVTYRKGQDDSPVGIVSSITTEEQATLVRDAARAQGFIQSYVGLELQTGDTLRDLDSAFSSWISSGNRAKFSDSDVVNIVGSSIGQKAVEALGAEWRRITDEHGTEIALVAEVPDIYSYPFSSVRYRIEDRQTNFISALFEALKRNIEERSSVTTPNTSLERTREG